MAIGDLHGEWWVAVAQFDTGPFLMYVGSWQGAQVQGNLYRIRIRDVGRRVRGEAWGGPPQERYPLGSEEGHSPQTPQGKLGVASQGVPSQVLVCGQG